MFAQALLNPIPKVLIDDRRMLAFMDLAFMGDAADIDRVRQEFVDVPPAEQAAAGRAACAIDANRNPQTLGVEGLLEADDASRFEIALEQGAHDRGMIIDDVQSAIFDPRAVQGGRRIREPSADVSTDDIQSSEYFNTQLIACAAFFKDNGFYEEHEWRLITGIKMYRDEGLKFRPGHSMLIPYYIAQLAPKGWRDEISSVTIGPCPYPAASEQAITGLFLKHGPYSPH
jgi:hypothetical protein